MSYQNDQKNAAQLMIDAQQEEFLRGWGDFSFRLQSLGQYDFSDLFRIALLREDFLTWEELIDAISRIMKRLYPREARRDNLADFRYRLIERRFSSNFIETFDRVAYRQIGRKSDLIIMHFSKDMDLRDLVQLEDIIGKYYFEALSSSVWQVNNSKKLRKVIIL